MDRTSWEKQWDEKALAAQKTHPLKVLSHIPSMPGIAAETSRHLTWKSLKYIFTRDKTKIIPRYILKHPFKYSYRFLKSLLRKKAYTRDDDFFLYGIKTLEEFKTLLHAPNTLLIVGFSYCHKPFECPSGRFTDACAHDLDNPTCQQCFIGKAVHSLPKEGAIPLFIPTIHYIGEKIFEIQAQYPDKKHLFLITACELTLEMFGDLGNMAGIQGIGVRLDGRICNTFKAFELSEEGIKPGLTILLDHTQKRILDLLWHRKNFKDKPI